MPAIQPSRSDVHVNRPLTNISIAFLQRAEAFVAGQVFPAVPVSKRSDQYFTYDRGYFNRDEMAERAPGAESEGATYAIGTATYNCKVWALHRMVPDQVRDNADAPLNLDRDAVEFLTHKGLIRKERDWVSKFFQASVWGTDLAGVDSGTPGAGQFSRFDRADSEPIEVIRQYSTVMGEATGLRPNKIVMQRHVYDKLIDHPDIVGRLDRGQTAGPAMVKRDALAALFEVDQVLVMDAVYNSAAEGATNVHSFIGGKHLLLLYAAPNPGLMTPSAGYTFRWTGHIAGGVNGLQISKWYMQEKKADRVEIEMSHDHKVVATDLGVFFENAVS